MLDIKEDRVVDARNLLCPMPILAATREMKLMQPSQVMKVLATDRGALADFPAWADDTGHELLGSEAQEGVLVFYIRKGTDA